MPPLLDPRLNPAAVSALVQGHQFRTAAAIHDKTRAAAEDFESVFLNTMLQQMFSGVGQGPFNGGAGAGIWRSFLTDEYAKSIVKAGGIGIADHVQRALLAQQELR